MTAALVAGVSGIARADDSSMSRLTGDSYAYFNGEPDGNPVLNNAPSAWRQANPNGVSERVFQSYSAPGEAWHLNKPVVDPAPSTFAQSHSNGLSERELQALSSEGPAWHQPNQSATSALASTSDATNMPSASREPFGARIARFFHVTPGNQTAPAN
ncbi:MAG TPA: hypothetical protein VN326_13405 [Casimicrobiaceae bacterium]|nr:hypothetical protein [Casimicrobiaceae bacterium]